MTEVEELFQEAEKYKEEENKASLKEDAMLETIAKRFGLFKLTTLILQYQNYLQKSNKGYKEGEFCSTEDSRSFKIKDYIIWTQKSSSRVFHHTEFKFCWKNMDMFFDGLLHDTRFNIYYFDFDKIMEIENMVKIVVDELKKIIFDLTLKSKEKSEVLEHKKDYIDALKEIEF